jgi:hypothetical protein
MATIIKMDFWLHWVVGCVKNITFGLLYSPIHSVKVVGPVLVELDDAEWLGNLGGILISVTQQDHTCFFHISVCDRVASFKMSTAKCMFTICCKQQGAPATNQACIIEIFCMLGCSQTLSSGKKWLSYPSLFKKSVSFWKSKCWIWHTVPIKCKEEET